MARRFQDKVLEIGAIKNIISKFLKITNENQNTITNEYCKNTNFKTRTNLGNVLEKRTFLRLRSVNADSCLILKDFTTV